MKKLEAVIFDWAGTTVDYGCFAPVQAFAEVFKAFGIEPAMEEVREPMGMLKRDHIKAMLAMPRIRTLWEEKYGRPSEEADIDSLYQMFEGKLMSILENFTDIKPGVLETVKVLREKGIAIGSTTGYTDGMMEIVVKKAEEQIPKKLVWPETENIKVQDFRGKMKNDVVQEGLTSTFIGSGDTVMEQMPEAGTTLSAEGGEVWIYLGNDKVK